MKISLRAYKLSDVEEFMDWCDEKVVARSRISHFSTKEEAQAYLEEVAIPHPWNRAICLDGRPVGFISVAPESGSHRCRGVISYGVGSKYWGQGIATRAVEMTIPIVFEEFPDLERLEGYTDVDNKASLRVLHKTGFQKEGVLKKYFLSKENKALDVVMHSIIKN